MTHISENSRISFSVKTWAMIIAFTLVTVVPMGIAFDGYYAHASDVENHLIELQLVKVTFEQSQNTMRLDILDDRIDRELDKPRDRRDNRKVEKLKKQYKRLEKRQDFLDNEQLKREMSL